MFLIPTCLDSDPTKRNSFNYVFMYIPIGPSKKQLYKIVIALLLLCYILFLGMYKPKAASVYTDSVPGVSTTILNTSPQVIATGSKFNNVGSGKLYLSIMYYNTDLDAYFNPITSVAIDSGTATFQCDIGNTATYNDEGAKKTIVISAICPVNFTDTGYRGLRITRASTPRTSIAISRNMTFIDESGSTDTSAIIAAISAQTTDIVSRLYNNQVDTQNLVAQIIAQLQTNQTTINNIQNNTSEINDSINDSSIDSSSATSFKDNSAFQDNNGLDAIIKAPLNFIQSLTSSTCSSISLTIPYINADVSLPCMSTIYDKALGEQLVNLIALVINGVVLYRYCLKILQIVKDAKNPNKDGLEVLDL